MSEVEERDATFARLRTVEHEFNSDTATVIESIEPAPVTAPVVTYDDGKPAVIVTLKHPFSLDGTRIAELHLSPPAFGDVEAVLTREISILDLYARMANVHADVLRAMRWPDMERFSAKAKRLAPTIEVR